MMHFSLFGKHIMISIPRHAPPVENGRGIIWEDAVLTSQSTFSLPPTPKYVISTAENYLISLFRTVCRPHLMNQRSRMIVVERPHTDIDVVRNTVHKEVDEDTLLSSYTEGTIHPANMCDQEFTDEDTYHMGFDRAPEECEDFCDYQDQHDESF